MTDEEEVTETRKNKAGNSASTLTLSVLIGAIESFHTRPRVDRGGAARSADVRVDVPVNISKQVEALHGNEDFSFARACLE
jgi:hypothetical protein